MKPRFIYVHGNDSMHWSFGWAPWLKSQLEDLGYETFFETMPDSIIARAEYWLPFLKDHIKVGESDVLIGWSSGATAALRYAEDNKLLGSVLVSPSYTDLGDELEKRSGYFSKSWNWENIRDHQSHIALFWGDDDPYIPQDEFAFIAEQIQPKQHKMQGAGHFIDYETFPELLDYIKQTYMHA
jgi:predicted alpha/beta hydrolase family esterase